MTLSDYDLEHHRLRYVDSIERVIKAYQQPESVRSANAALLARLIDKAEYHRSIYIGAPRDECDRICGTITDNARRASCLRALSSEASSPS